MHVNLMCMRVRRVLILQDKGIWLFLWRIKCTYGLCKSGCGQKQAGLLATGHTEESDPGQRHMGEENASRGYSCGRIRAVACSHCLDTSDRILASAGGSRDGDTAPADGALPSGGRRTRAGHNTVVADTAMGTAAGAEARWRTKDAETEIADSMTWSGE